MRIKLLSNGMGILTVRDPIAVNKDFVLEVEGASNTAEIVLEQVGGGAYRRSIINEKTEIPSKALEGNVRVTVIDNGRRWECEELIGKRQSDGCVTVVPNNAKLPDTVVKLCIENEDMRCSISRLSKELEETKEYFKGICEGYDIV